MAGGLEEEGESQADVIFPGVGASTVPTRAARATAVGPGTSLLQAAGFQLPARLLLHAICSAGVLDTLGFVSQHLVGRDNKSLFYLCLQIQNWHVGMLTPR